jgi:beta-barrel assembly-enhancing protease
MVGHARYFDGKTAKDHDVTLNLSAAHLSIRNEADISEEWPLTELRAIEPYRAGQMLRLMIASQPGARLNVSDGSLAHCIAAAAPQLAAASAEKSVLKVGAWFLGGLAVLAGIAHFALTYAPDHFAGFIPQNFARKMGDGFEKSLVADAKICTTAAGEKALATMAGALAEGNADMPAIRIRVYDMALVNAFTLPGASIVLTRGLLEKADRPEEVAGVLAHEIGHAQHLHPEAQLIRVAGLQLMLSVVSGGTANSSTANIAGLAAILRSSREAEREADAHALSVLNVARIDPMGFKTFFEKMSKDSPDTGGETVSALGNIFSTHPGTADRMALIKPLPAGVQAKPVMTSAQWQDLRKICSG